MTLNRAKYRDKKKKIDSAPIEKFGATDVTKAIEERRALAEEIDNLERTLIQHDHCTVSNREVLRRMLRAVIGLQKSVVNLERSYLRKELENA